MGVVFADANAGLQCIDNNHNFTGLYEFCHGNFVRLQVSAHVTVSVLKMTCVETIAQHKRIVLVVVLFGAVFLYLLLFHAGNPYYVYEI